GKIAGVDIRTVGSGNVGATNVARAAGKSFGVLTLLFDAAKGFAPVIAAQRLELSVEVVAVTAIAAFLGHLYPLYLKFKGGKGVATGFGALLALAPMTTLVLIVVFALVVVVSRIVSLGSIAAAVATPLVLWLFHQPPVIVAMGGFLGAMAIFRHRTNIQRLLAGTEPRFGSD
ncbi:MAG TPA: glycerol-3-phosphate 1-O-acyltransferase PlsY, partial [Candidatus Binatus sp.]|nr:glycerol-3-phosphate 1-O-acyltransferase PlsY [Candidatus Binatus sp.]